MNKIEELLKNLCPNGVEYKKLWNVTEWDKKFNGTTKEQQRSTCKFNHISANELKSLEDNSGKIKLLSTGNYDGYTTEEKAGKNINSGEIFTIPSGGTANIKYYNGLFIDSGNIIGKSNDVNKYSTKYIYYWLLNNYIEIQSFFRGSGVKHPDMVSILNMSIPVPPLEVQCEIVHILDHFTLLSAELSAELRARQKQYEFYRDELFKFKNYNNVEYIKLGNIAEIIRGGNFQKKDFIESGFPCIHYGQIYTKYGLYANKTYTFIAEEVAKKSKIASPNDVVMAVTSENIEDVCKCVAWVGNTDIAVSGHTAIIKSNINAKYLSYYFHTSMFYIQKLKLVHGTKVMEVTPSSLENILVPVVPEDKQKKIVKILDNLDKLCNDISEGLPAEIEARQKQYEYYRDKLLTFKELKVNE